MSQFDDSDWNDEDFDKDFDRNFDYDDDKSHHESIVGMSDVASMPMDYMERWKQLDADLKEQEINLAILHATIAMCQRSWLWGWRTANSRLAMIHRNYYALMDMIRSE